MAPRYVRWEPRKPPPFCNIQHAEIACRDRMAKSKIYKSNENVMDARLREQVLSYGGTIMQHGWEAKHGLYQYRPSLVAESKIFPEALLPNSHPALSQIDRDYRFIHTNLHLKFFNCADGYNQHSLLLAAFEKIASRFLLSLLAIPGHFETKSISKMASGRQPPSPHSCLLDNDRLFAEALPVWIPSYETSNARVHCRNTDTEDFEIDWPVLDRYEDETDNLDIYQRSPWRSGSTKKSERPYKMHRSTTCPPAPIVSYSLPDSRSFLNTNSKQVLPLKLDDNMGLSRTRPIPPPLVLTMSAFKVDRMAIPPAPPPTPFQTPPPTPPFCPEYEEHSTLGAFNTPAISRSPSNLPDGLYRSSKNRRVHAGAILKLPSYSPSDSETDFEDDEQDIGSGTSGCFTEPHSLDEYEPASPPPPIPLVRTTSHTHNELTVPISNTGILSKSLPATPTRELTLEMGMPSTSFFDWDAEPEISNHNTQWTKFKVTTKTYKRRDSDSSESQTSKNSVRVKAERIRKKLENVFGIKS